RMTAFNRGRARYPLLRAGTYRITVVYTPKWDDAEFTQTGVGARRSNTLELEVTNSPPAGIIGPNASPLITLNNVRGHVVAQLTNRRDLPVRINTNFSTGKPPFSALRWMVYFDKDWRDCPTSPAPDLPFSRDRLVEVRPGERLELGRVQLTELRRVAKLDASDTLFVRVLYTNLLDRRWQRQAKHPSAELSAPLPEHLLLTTLHSEPLRDDGNSSSGKAKVETP
ncbi:MAG: hypothetical protein GY842_22465, partial [bacterium]|nr:hypothetical protein [bacterium]